VAMDRTLGSSRRLLQCGRLGLRCTEKTMRRKGIVYQKLAHGDEGVLLGMRPA